MTRLTVGAKISIPYLASTGPRGAVRFRLAAPEGNAFDEPPAAHSTLSDPVQPSSNRASATATAIGGAETTLAAAMIAVFIFLLFRNLGGFPESHAKFT
jgi:hypothetical protein